MNFEDWLTELDIVMRDDGNEARVDIRRAKRNWQSYTPQEYYDELLAPDHEAEKIDLRYEL